MAILKSHCRRSSRVALLLTFLATLAGAQPMADEAKFEAVYLIKFIRFVTWPTTTLPPDQPLVIGVLGADPFGRTLEDAAAGETIETHPLVIRHYRRLSDAEGCQVLFISYSEQSRLRSILSSLRGRSVLTVSDIDDFTEEGGVVRFLVENNKLRFRINIAAAHDDNITISSKLLELAEIVNGPKSPAQ